MDIITQFRRFMLRSPTLEEKEKELLRLAELELSDKTKNKSIYAKQLAQWIWEDYRSGADIPETSPKEIKRWAQENVIWEDSLVQEFYNKAKEEEIEKTENHKEIEEEKTFRNWLNIHYMD